MISHVLGKGQGYPVGSKMPGVFKTVEDLLRAFVRDYKPRSSKPEPGKAAEPELMLLVFTDKEMSRMEKEIKTQVSSYAMMQMAVKLNTRLHLKKGFMFVGIEMYGHLTGCGLVFCPENMDWPANLNNLKTGSTKDENSNDVSYMIQKC